MRSSRRHFGILGAAACAMFAGAVVSQVSAMEVPVGIVEEPCSTPVEPPPALRDMLVKLFLEPRSLTPSDLQNFVSDPRIAEFNEASRKRAIQDWSGLCRYRDANARAATASVTPLVVFIGDSITENWVEADPAFFERGIIGRGIGGQTTPQMLVRFRADVVALKPRMVHIMAGTNDVAGNTGPTRPQDYKNNIISMVEIARANGIGVILGSIPPAASFSWRPQIKPVPLIKELNAWLRDYAAREHLVFIDYYTALAGPAGELRSDLGNDGVHPNRNGYAVMKRLVTEKLPR
jgi:lysophospholipase L1-like esterase